MIKDKNFLGYPAFEKLVFFSSMSRSRFVEMFLALCRAPTIQFLFHLIGTSNVQCVGNFPVFFLVDFAVETVVAVTERSITKMIRAFFTVNLMFGW